MRALLLPLLLTFSGCAASPSVITMDSGKVLHVGMFWFQPEVTPAQQREFRTAVRNVRGVDGLESVWAGTPAGTQHPAVDDSYGMLVVMRFRDRAALDAWGPHPVHQEIVQKYGGWMQKVAIYDALE